MKKAFIEVVSPENAEGALKRAYKRVGGSRGAIAHVHQSQSLNPRAMLGHLDLYMAIMYQEDSPLSRLQRELIGTVVSVMNNCDYCILHHYEALQTHWVDAPPAEDVVNGVGLSKNNLVLLNHIQKLVNKPWEINENDIEKLRDAEFDDRAILDITMITGYFCFVNRLTMGLGVSIEQVDERDYKY